MAMAPGLGVLHVTLYDLGLQAYPQQDKTEDKNNNAKGLLAGTHDKAKLAILQA